MASVKAAYTTKELVELLQVDAHTSVIRPVVKALYAHQRSRTGPGAPDLRCVGDPPRAERRRSHRRQYARRLQPCRRLLPG